MKERKKKHTHAKILHDLKHHPTLTSSKILEHSLSLDHLNDGSRQSTELNYCTLPTNARCCTTNSGSLLTVNKVMILMVLVGANTKGALECLSA